MGIKSLIYCFLKNTVLIKTLKDKQQSSGLEKPVRHMLVMHFEYQIWYLNPVFIY